MKRIEERDRGRETATGREPGRPRAAAWLWWLVVGAVAAAALGAWALWRQHVALARRSGELPAMPDISAQPAALGAALRGAVDHALSSRQGQEGVEELGRLYHANGYNKEAEACWRILLREQPREARWCYYLADVRRTAGNDGEMAALLEQTVTLAPDYVPAWLRLAEWEFKTGRLDEAERDYRRRLALRPGDPYASLGLARVALQRDRRSEGRRLIEQIVHDVPTFPPAHNLYAEMLAADGDADGADTQRWLGRMAGRFRDAEDPWLDELHAWCYDPSRLAVLAAIEYQTKYGDRGESILKRVIQLAPKDSRGYLELGKLYLNVGEPAKARTVLEEGIKLPNAPSLLYVYQCQAYCDLRQPAEALGVADRALALMPGLPELENARGVVLRAAGRLGEAIAPLRLAIAGSPNVCEPNFNLGITLLQLGRKEEAYVYLKRALALEPTYPEGLAVLGQSEMEAGQLESAAQYLRPLYRFYPGLTQARQLMTRWYLQAGMGAVRAGRLAEAEGDFRDGLTVSPDLAELHGRLGLLYAQEQRSADALEQLETFHRLQPSDPKASLFLGQVYVDLGRMDDARRILTEGRQLALRAGDAPTEAQCGEILQKLSK